MVTPFRDRWLNSFSWLWLLVFGGLGAYLICNPGNADSRPTAEAVLCRQAGVVSDFAVPNSATRNIEDIRVGDRVLGNNPDKSEVDAFLPDPEPATWRKLRLRMPKANGDDLAIELLRPLEWIEFYEAARGRTIELDLPEMGAQGVADVLSVDPCPPIQRGPGNVVTGTFAHKSAGDLINLYVSGEPRPIGVTRNHRYWSEDRREFVEAGDLRVGERLLRGTGGITTMMAVEPRSTDEPVHNLEVHQQHVYLVGQLGVLVHNNYTKSTLYRALREEDVVAYRTGQRLRPKGVVNDPELHVKGGKTLWMSASESLEGARKYDLGLGVAEMDAHVLQQSGSRILDHKNLLQRLRDSHDIDNAKDALEVLIKNGIDPQAIKRIIPPGAM